MKRKRHKSRKPDEVFGNSVVSVARFGKDIVWRSNLDAAGFARLQDHYVGQFDEVVAEIDKLVKAVAELVSQLPAAPLLQRAWWGLASRHTKIRAEAEMDQDDALAMRMLDYVQSIIASVPPAVEQKTEVSDADWTSLHDLISKLFGTLNLSYQICRTAKAKKDNPGLDMEFEAFFFKAQSYWCNVRGERYQVHEEPYLRDLFEPHSAVLEQEFGLTAETFVREIAKIVDSLTLGLGRALADIEAFRTESLAAVEAKIQAGSHIGKDFDTLFEEVVAENKWEARRANAGGAVFGFDLFDVEKLTALPTELIDELTWRPGEDEEFFAPGQFSGWPLRVWPTFKRPFIRLDNHTYCFDLHSLCDGLYRGMSRIIRRRRPDYEEGWKLGQQAISEELPLKYLARILPGAETYRSVYYKWRPSPGQTNLDWCEVDGLLRYDDHLFIVESRGGAFTHSSPATDFEAYIASIKNLLLKPATQGRRFLEYLNSQDQVELFDREHNVVGTLRAAEFRHISTCAVTLDPFTELAAQAQHLKKLGVDVGDRPVWPISSDDLRVYADTFANPLQFLHYVEQRTAAFASDILELDDELDHLGLYLEHNHYSSYAEERFRASGARINFLGYRSNIDKFFAERIGDPTFPCPLTQDAPPRFVEIIDFISRTKIAGRSRFASYLLDLGSGGRGDLTRCIEGELKRQPNRGRPFAFSTVGGLRVPNTTFVYLEGAVKRDEAIALRLAREAMLLSGEPERLLITLSYSRDQQLSDVDWKWLTVAEIPAQDLPSLQEGAEKLRAKRLAASGASHGRVGRNDLCPCGSGKKFKKCCI